MNPELGGRGHISVRLHVVPLRTKGKHVVYFPPRRAGNPQAVAKSHATPPRSIHGTFSASLAPWIDVVISKVQGSWKADLFSFSHLPCSVILRTSRKFHNIIYNIAADSRKTCQSTLFLLLCLFVRLPLCPRFQISYSKLTPC